eukprot:3587190-Rhodomonas_salina.1
MLHCATAATCNSSNLLLSNNSSILNVQQQQLSTFQQFINFERATAATFYIPTLHQFRMCNSSNLLLSNASSTNPVSGAVSGGNGSLDKQQLVNLLQHFVIKLSLGL